MFLKLSKYVISIGILLNWLNSCTFWKNYVKIPWNIIEATKLRNKAEQENVYFHLLRRVYFFIVEKYENMFRGR